MALTFGQITVNSDGTGTAIDLGDVQLFETLLSNQNFNKSIPFTTSSEKINVNLFGSTRRVRIVGTIAGADCATFSYLINLWFNERQSRGRYVRSKFNSTALRVTIESARLPEAFPADLLQNYELVLIEGTN